MGGAVGAPLLAGWWSRLVRNDRCRAAAEGLLQGCPELRHLLGLSDSSSSPNGGRLDLCALYRTTHGAEPSPGSRLWEVWD